MQQGLRLNFLSCHQRRAFFGVSHRLYVVYDPHDRSFIMLVSLPQFSHHSRTFSCCYKTYFWPVRSVRLSSELRSGQRDGPLTDSRDVTTVLDLVDRDVVIVYTLSGRVDALKPITAAIVVVAGRGHAST